MEWLLLAVGGLLALLAVPLQLGFALASGGGGGPLRKRVRVRWAFGLVAFTAGGGETPPTVEGRRAPGPRRRVRHRSRINGRALLLNPAFWAWLRRLLARLFGSLHWRLLELEARIGFDDPADTGRLWGGVAPLLAVSRPGTHVDIQPVFEGETFAFKGKGEVRVVPLQLLWVLLSFAVAPATWRVFRPAWRSG